MPIAVEGHRLPILLKIMAGCFTVAKKGFLLDKPQFDQLACRIIDKHQQRTSLPACLKPGMLRAIDLDQLPKTSTSFSHLVYCRWLGASRFPQLLLDHQLANTFA
jgi:hypothetical protein